MAREHKGHEIVGQNLTMSGMGREFANPLKVNELEMNYGDEFLFVGRARATNFAYPKSKDKRHEDGEVNEDIKAEAIEVAIFTGNGKIAKDVKAILKADVVAQRKALDSMIGQEQLGIDDD